MALYQVKASFGKVGHQTFLERLTASAMLSCVGLISVLPAPLAGGIMPRPAFVVCKPAAEFRLCTAGEAHRIRHFG